MTVREVVSNRAAQLLVALIVAAAVMAGFLATGAGSAAAAQLQAGVELTRLLRAMAGLKALMAAAAVVAVLWRLAAPVTAPRLAAYAVACGAMAAAPGLIWDMAHVAAGALLLHGGLLATGLLLWRDPAVAARLAAILARRRVSRVQDRVQTGRQLIPIIGLGQQRDAVRARALETGDIA